MERIMRQFFWGSSNNNVKKGWVGFKKLALSKERGGVGFKKLRLMNMALHAKWIWRYGKEEKALWRKVVNHKFDGNPKAFYHPQTTSQWERVYGQVF